MRARNIKPSLFTNERLAVADPLHTVIFTGLWCLADRDGRLEDRPGKIHMEINPGRTLKSTRSSLEWLAENKFIIRYRDGDLGIIQVVNFVKHQNPHPREKSSDLPALNGQPQAEQSLYTASHEITGPARLIPDSPILIPDSPSLIPDPPITGLPAQDGSDTVETVFAHWQNIWNHQKAHLDQKRRKVIKNALAAYSVADLCAAISGYRNSPHHTGENERATVYDDIGLFLRDAAHIDAGLHFAAEPPRSEHSTLTRRNVAAVDDWQPPEMRNAGR